MLRELFAILAVTILACPASAQDIRDPSPSSGLIGYTPKSGAFYTSKPDDPIVNSPSDVTSARLKIWLKSDIGVLNSGGAACGHGEAVQTWQDQSGNGNNLTKNGATAPSYLITGNWDYKGRGVIYSAGSASLTSAAVPTLVQPVTVYAVMKIDGVSDGRVLWDGAGGTNNTNSPVMTASSNPNTTLQLNSGAAGPTYTVATTTYNIVETYINGTKSYIALNGTIGTAANAGTNNPAGLTLFSSPDRTGATPARFSEVCVFQGSLTVSDRRQLLNYFKKRWGINVTLP